MEVKNSKMKAQKTKIYALEITRTKKNKNTRTTQTVTQNARAAYTNNHCRYYNMTATNTNACIKSERSRTETPPLSLTMMLTNLAKLNFLSFPGFSDNYKLKT